MVPDGRYFKEAWSEGLIQIKENREEKKDSKILILRILPQNYVLCGNGQYQKSFVF
tara:strand:- start:21798 stop:21965 length:168 start_codon:yes stop_codon:yes gene_type:complete